MKACNSTPSKPNKNKSLGATELVHVNTVSKILIIFITTVEEFNYQFVLLISYDV
jgi:hypothetical protein